MPSPDRPIGVEAITTLPLHDVLLSKHDALPKLQRRTLDVFRRNLVTTHEWLSQLPEDMRDENMLALYPQFIANPGLIAPIGGLHYDEEMINELYGPKGPATFPHLLNEISSMIMAKSTSPTLQTLRLPGVEGMNAFLDALHMLQPQFASSDDGVFADGVEVILNHFQGDGTDEEIFRGGDIVGLMCDDTMHLRSRTAFGRDIRADSEGAERFLNTALIIATPLAKEGIRHGIKEAQNRARLREVRGPLDN